MQAKFVKYLTAGSITKAHLRIRFNFYPNDVIYNDESFEKLVSLVETYFQAGGWHIQLNYVSRETLNEAKKNPQQYKSLRVRVSGFSAYFTSLQEELQNNVIERTTNRI